MNPASGMHARFLVRHFAKQHVAETEFNETPRAWIERARRTQAAMNSALGVRVNGADLNQLIVDFEELESVETGTHPDLVRNAALTVDNTLELTERITRQINATVTELLASAEPFARTEDKVSA